MSTAQAAAALSERLAACTHCGNPIPHGEPAGRAGFCCRGCELVHQILKDRKLDHYYELKRDDLPARAALPAPDPSQLASYGYLDGEEFRLAYADAPAGQSGQGHPAKMKFYLEGVHCAACVWLIEKVPEFVPGVRGVSLDFGRSVATVELADAQSSYAAVATEFHRLGYRPHPVRDGEEEALARKELRRMLVQAGVAAACAGNIMLMAVSLYGGAAGEWGALFRWISFALYLPVLFYSAIPFYRSAWSAIRARQVSIDIPIVLGIVVGTLASFINLLRAGEGAGESHPIYFDSLAALVFLLLGSRVLLKRSQQSALSAANLAQFLTPSVAHRRKGPGLSGLEDVPASALRPGDVVEVRPAEAIPADGIVLEGRSMLNWALLTGEADWVPAGKGDAVFAGTLNQDAPLSIEVRGSGAESRLGQILEATTQGLARKAPIVAFTDRMSRWFVWATLGLVALAYYVGARHGWEEGLNRALAMAIVLCPCAFALATPLAMSLALGRAARAGILIKGGDVLEKLSHVDTVILDKTGTLTTGQFEVLEVCLAKGAPADLAGLVVGLEAASLHPIAKALVRHFRPQLSETGELPRFEDLKETPGVGVAGTLEGHRYELRRADGAQGSGTVVALTRETKGAPAGGEAGRTLLAEIHLGDSVRQDSLEAVRGLRKRGFAIRVLSGDRISAVARVAESLGMPAHEAYAAASPEEKARFVEGYPRALMAGDGANDAIALASAYVGVAVHGGMEVSLRVADVYLNGGGGVSPIGALLTLGRESMRVVRRNLVFSITYNVVGVGAALIGTVNPLFAAVLMPASAFTVFLSSSVGTRALRRLSEKTL